MLSYGRLTISFRLVFLHIRGGCSFGHYPTFHTLMSVGRKKLSSMSKECCPFFVLWLRKWINSSICIARWSGKVLYFPGMQSGKIPSFSRKTQEKILSKMHMNPALGLFSGTCFVNKVIEFIVPCSFLGLRNLRRRNLRFKSPVGSNNFDHWNI